MHPHFEQIADQVNERFGPLRVETNYDTMVATFGPPNSSDDPYKTDVAWDVRGPDGAVHIYNYKNGPAYQGAPFTLADIYEFSVQGESEAAVRSAAAAVESIANGAHNAARP
jgi:hypothetical protein